MSVLGMEIERISNEWNILKEHWKIACEKWHDPTQQRFDNEFWHEFEKLFPAYLRKLQETSSLIDKADRELDF